MATAVLTSTPTIITLCESIVGFSGDTFSLNADFPLQGTNDVSCAMTNNGINDIRYATLNSPGGEFAATNIHLRMPGNFSFVGDIETDANNGIQLVVVSGSGTAYYTVGGSTTYSGGWKQFVVYTGNTPTSGSVPSGTCTSIGFRINTKSKPRNQPANAYFDAWYFGDGYTVTGGTSGDEIDWSHIAALDAAQAYKIVERFEDIYMLAGDIKICNGATTTYFKSGQKVQFKDLPVSSTLYGVTFAGSAGNVEITGGSWGAAGSQDYLFDASDTSLNSFTLSGVQFEKANSVLFSSTTGEKQQTVEGVVFNDCFQVDPRAALFTNISFRNSTDTGGALLWPSDDTNISNISFSNCDNDIEYAASSDATPSFLNITHDDNAGDFDVNNTSGGAITIAMSGTSNGNSSTGSGVTFSSSSTLSFLVNDESNTPVSDAYAYIDDNDNIPYIMNTTTDVSGVATVSHTEGAVTGARWRVRKYGYKPFKVISNIPASGTKEIPVTLIADPQQI